VIRFGPGHSPEDYNIVLRLEESCLEFRIYAVLLGLPPH